MGTHGQAHTTMVPYSIMNGEPTKDFSHGKDVRGNSWYWRCERQADFEVIEIVDDNNPYPTLLGIDWATDMNRVIDLKKCKMIFEKKSLRIVVPLDLAEGERYTEPVHDDESDCYLKIRPWKAADQEDFK